MCNRINNKRFIVSFLMGVFKKGMVFLSKEDKLFFDIIAGLPDGFSFSLKVKYSDLSVSFVKHNGILEFKENTNPDLILSLNNLCSAFLIFSGILPQYAAFAENRIAVKGNISDALVITMAIDRLQSVIFPDFISKKLIKNYTGSTMNEKNTFFKFYLRYMLGRL